MWCYVGDDRNVLFDFTPTGAAATGPWTMLAGRRGYLQADAATVFDRLYIGHPHAVAAAIEVGCWAHYLEFVVIRSAGVVGRAP